MSISAVTPRRARITTSQRPSWMGIARRLTGTDLERMVREYNTGSLHVTAPNGQALTRTAFVEVATYLRWDNRLGAAA